MCNLTLCRLRLLFAQINSIQAASFKQTKRKEEERGLTESPSCAAKIKPRPLPPSPSQDWRQEGRGQIWSWRMKGLGEREGVKSRTAHRTAPGLRILQHADICSTPLYRACSGLLLPRAGCQPLHLQDGQHSTLTAPVFGPGSNPDPQQQERVRHQTQTAGLEGPSETRITVDP